MSIDYSIVVPCYCSGAWLTELVERVLAAMTRVPGTVELVLVNDASLDDTWPVIAGLAAAHPEVRGLDLLGNVGQFRATLCGLEHARGGVIVTMDDDLQHRPEDVPVLIGRLRDDPDVDCVLGAFVTKRHGVFRNLGSRIYHRIEAALYGGSPSLRTSAFRAMRRAVAETIMAHRTARPVIAPLLLASARRIVNVEVPHEARQRGRSGYRIRDLFGIARDAVVAGSTAPLRALSLLGFGAAAGSAALMTWYLGRWLAGSIRVPGFTTEVLLITFFGGCTLLGVGLLGEYLARILVEVTGAPRWALRAATFETSDRRLRVADLARPDAGRARRGADRP